MAQDSFATEAFTLLAVALLVILLRTLARSLSAGIRRFAWDDYLMIFAAVLYTMETVAAVSVGARFKGLANNSMTPEQRASLSPDDPEWRLRIDGSKTQVIGWSLYTSLLWLLKLCMTIFYSRLTEGLPQTRVHVGLVLVGTTYVATILSILLGCRPLRNNWQINPEPPNHCQPAISKINLYVTVVLNVVTDLYLMSIPIPVLLKANMPRRRKCLLLVMFSGGIFVIMAGILRCVLILTAGANGAQQAGSWACRETFVAVVIGNIPMIYPLFTRCMRKLGATQMFSSHGLSDQSGSSLGKPRFERKSSGKPRFLHPLSTTNATASDSNDRIIEMGPVPTSKDGINITTETAVDVTAASSRQENRPYDNYSYAKPTGPGYSFQVNQHQV
ncbi:MAG: hypothetical protein M1817_002252 [Caeruleum heppii]|nr:MAG: hypothetical protein M1817_002252 [Caeruleum heppii]